LQFANKMGFQEKKFRGMTKTAHNIAVTNDSLRYHGDQQRQTARPSVTCRLRGREHYVCSDNAFTLLCSGRSLVAGHGVMYQQGLKQNIKDKDRQT
jgi:hypothetical protein